MSQYQYIYLHGLASSPLSQKAQYLNQCFQEKSIDLLILDLNDNDFSHLTLTRQINQVVDCFVQDSQQEIRIIGSSFGGLTAAWLAQKYSQIESIILLAPAFNFKNHWLPKLLPETIEQWKTTKYLPVYHYGEDKELPLHYQFVIDLNKYEDQQLNQSIPTLILHGINDQIIPIEASQQYNSDHSWANLIELDSDHSLTSVMPTIWQHIQQFWQL